MIDIGQFPGELQIPCPNADVEYRRTPYPSTSILQSRAVAVCVFGELRSLNTTAKALRENLFKVLNADVFVSTSDTGDFAMLQHLLGATSARAARLRVHRSEEYSRQALLNYFASLKNSNYTGLLELAERMNGTFHNFLSPLNYNFDWHGGHQLRHLQTCDDMITEQERVRGLKYRAVVFTRPDNLFLVPHPPIEKLGNPTKNGRCFIPDNPAVGALGDYLSDTGATCDRQGAAAYMTLGNLVAEIPHKIKCVDPVWCTSEDLLKCGLSWQSVQLVSVRPLFYLACDLSESQVRVKLNFSNPNTRKLAGSTGCSLVREHAVRVNYEAQFEEARKLSELVATQGWELTDWGCPRSLSIVGAEHYKCDPLLSTGAFHEVFNLPVRSLGLVTSVTLLSTTLAVLATRLVRHARRIFTCALPNK